MGNNFNKLHIAILSIAVILSCAHASTEDKKRAQISYDLGAESYVRNRTPEALDHFQKASQFDPEMPQPYNGLGLINHLKMKSYDEAIKNYKKALELEPKFSDAKNNLGAVYLDLDQCDKAIPLFQEALSDIFYKEPYLAEGNLGWCFYKTGKVEDGLSHLKNSIYINPKYCIGYRSIGIIFSELKNSDESIKYFQKYSENCPNLPDAFYRLGVEYDKSGKREEAKKNYSECSKLDPNGPTGEECRKLFGEPI
jgi:tetratricopeptide (TPR) repeat protein